MGMIAKYMGSQLRNPHGFWGKVVCKIQGHVNKETYRQVVSFLNLEPNTLLLEIGYGNGRLLEMIYKKMPVQMYGIDISEDAQEMAARRNRKARKADQLHLYIGDCCDLAFPCDAFDVITTVNTVYFWKDIAKGFQEIHRVLKPGAVFVNVCHTKSYLEKASFAKNGFNKPDVEELIRYGREAGFVNAEVKEIVPDKSVAIVFTKGEMVEGANYMIWE